MKESIENISLSIKEAINNLKSILIANNIGDAYINVFFNDTTFRISPRSRYLIKNVSYNEKSNSIELETSIIDEDLILIPPTFITIKNLIDKLEKLIMFDGLIDAPDENTKIVFRNIGGLTLPFKTGGSITKDKGINNLCLEYFGKPSDFTIADDYFGNLGEIYKKYLDTELAKEIINDPQIKKILGEFIGIPGKNSLTSDWTN